MSGRIRYTEEFKKDAVYPVTDRGCSDQACPATAITKLKSTV